MNKSTNTVSIYKFLEEKGANLDEINKVKNRYPVKISSYYLNLIKEKDDPIWKQCVPSIEELQDIFNISDPLEEESHTPVPNLVHKYPDRVLLLASSVCAMYCRFCTRKRKVGKNKQIPMQDIMTAIDYIREHEEVRDVIISGGDPLMRTDKEIEQILKALKSIPHIQVVRIGTRVPCVFPKRITKKFVRMLKKYHPLYMNIHFNHPSEITEESGAVCKSLADAGIVLSSQSVLLKGVNDSIETIKELMQKLLQIRVKPYYIYQCDLVKGVEHYRTDLSVGIDLMKQLQGYTSGLCVPHFVIDGPGGKVPVSPMYIKNITPEQVMISNYLGNLFNYPNTRKHHIKKFANKRVSRIGIAFNLKREPQKGERPDKYAECDDLETVNAIRQTIEAAGYEVVLLEANENLMEKLPQANVDFVFNIAEGIHGESRESHIPSILEMLNIPYSGSGVLTQAITLNKSRKKEILHYYGVPTPPFQLFRKTNEKLKPELTFPLIVKPDAEGSSVGILNSAVVYDEPSLKKQVSYILKNYCQAALVEKFCTGREFTVALIGNTPKVLPIIEINFEHLPPDLKPIDSYEAKWIYDQPGNPIDPLICPANLSQKLKIAIEKIAKQTFNVLGCRDFCRIDIRLDENNIPNVLDVNALPGLMPDVADNSRFIRACVAKDMSYQEIIMTILNSALKRYNLLIDKQNTL